jgi:ABC-type bacteriocin/lantibiotic exporter with double-glycine peptidase domain
MMAVPHFSQEKDKTCVPASVRMILAYLGIERSENEIAALLGATPDGTSVMNIENLSRWGLKIWIGDLSAESLREKIDRGLPTLVIVKLNLVEEIDANGNRNHTLVAVGYDEMFVYVNDALSDECPKSLPWDDFLTAWDAFGNFSAILKKTESHTNSNSKSD